MYDLQRITVAIDLTPLDSHLVQYALSASYVLECQSMTVVHMISENADKGVDQLAGEGLVASGSWVHDPNPQDDCSCHQSRKRREKESEDHRQATFRL